ncbi:MAG: NAD(P)-dependent alcohol dehydrogenase [Bacteroidota bacterium]
MKKIVYKSYGSPDVLQVVEVPIPEPGKNQVLVKVIAAGVNPIDYKNRNGSMKMIAPGKFPRTPGAEISGIVEKTGHGAQKFNPGDNVYAMLSMAGGGYSQYIVLKENLLCNMPHNIGFSEAAAAPLAGLTALQSLRDKGKIKKGMNVLVNGASGGVGMFGVQIAKAYECTVTAVCSGKNISFVESLGADHSIDYKEEDFTQTQEKYDIVFDAVATSTPRKCSRIIKPGGTFVTTLPGPSVMLRQITNPVRPRKTYGILTQPNGDDLKILAGLIEKNKFKIYLDQVYNIDEAPKAHQYIETRRVRGKLVIKMVQ